VIIMGAKTGLRAETLSPDRNVVRWIMKLAGNPRISVQLWNGEEFRVTESRPVACMEIRSRRAVFDLLRSPSIGFGECYSKGLIEIHGDFLAFINELTRSVTANRRRNYYFSRVRSHLHAMRRNTLSNSRHNVHMHYDLGNDFFRLWLDERMVYTCAYYATPSVSLDEAQVAKLDHVCRKLQLRPGQKVIEAGCGWGALALHMAEHYGVDVVAYNNSRAQVAYAREQATARRLDDRVTFVEDDYRKIDERCDVFVSIGMLEHVGMANFGALGALIKRVLKPDGVGLVHSIGRSYPFPPDPWITRHIFPGGHMPSLGEIMRVFEPHKFSVLDVENLRPHYARTCADWLKNFEAISGTVADMYDKEFVRKWRLYLAGASAGFESGTLQLYQVLFAPQENRDVPWTREYQYPETTVTH
jgi:cyclopropane-fatty-acyl-phospholipid synthase